MPQLNLLIESAVKNGISVVVCLIIIAIFAKILQWVFRFVDKLVTESLVSLASAMGKLSESIQRMNETSALSLAKISQEMRDGFEQMHRTAQYQRDEHQKMMERMDNAQKQSDEARERLLNAIRDNECEAGRGK